MIFLGPARSHFYVLEMKLIGPKAAFQRIKALVYINIYSGVADPSFYVNKGVMNPSNSYNSLSMIKFETGTISLSWDSILISSSIS